MIENYIDIYNKFVDKVNKTRKYNQYKYLYGNHNGLEKKNYDEISAPLFSDGFNWPFKCDEVWFKGKLVIPDKVAGIITEKSKVVYGYYSQTTSALWINGEKKLDEKWWVNKDFVLTESLEKKNYFDITIRFRRYDGNFIYWWPGIIPTVYIDNVESVIFKIAAFFKVLEYIDNSIKINLIRDIKLVEKYNEITSKIPIKLLENENIIGFIDYIDKVVQTELKLFEKYVKNNISYMIGHAHIDMNWLWDWQNTLEITKDTFEQAIKFMNEYPQFHFSQSQAVLYKTVEKNYPELFNKIKSKVKDKKWEITASTWVECDLNIPSGESLIRQILYAKKYIKNKFRLDIQVGWAPDTFGHCATYPQILKKCGVNYYYFCRCGKNIPLFYWEGIDGSRVLAFNEFVNWYSGPVTVDLFLRFEKLKLKHTVNRDLICYGVGNHGGGPTRRDIETIIKLQKFNIFNRIKFSSVSDFFKDIEKTKKNIPIIKGELNYYSEGGYTTHSDIKKFNRESENMIITAEIFSVIASLYGLKYPLDEITQAWENICFNQFHDIICGTAVHVAYDYSQQLAENVIKTAKNIITKSTEYITDMITIEGNNDDLIPIVVFNPLSWVRNDIVELDITDFGPCSVKDIYGTEISSQIYDNKLFFVANKVPSIGYKTYYLSKKQIDTNVGEQENIQNLVFENDRYLFEFDSNSGGIKRLYNKIKKKELINIQEQGNIFKLYTELPEKSSAWTIGQIKSVDYLYQNAKIKKVLKGPVFDLIEIEIKFRNSYLTQKIMFFKEIDRIEFRTKLIWNEIGTPEYGTPMLRVSFVLDINSEKVDCEIPFGVITRPVNGQEIPVQKFINFSDGELGVSLINNCKYGYNIRGNNVELTIVRSPFNPDLKPDIGEHIFTYALYPHDYGWQKTEVTRKGYELNFPLIPVIKNKKGTINILPIENSFVQLDKKNVVVSCLKLAENKKGIIMHAYEIEGKKCKCNFLFGWKINKIIETNLIENKIVNSKRIKFEFNKWEIKSFFIVSKTITCKK